MADSQQIDKFSYLPLVLVIKIISLLTFSQAYNLCLLRPDWLQAQLWRNCCAIDLHEMCHLNRGRMRHQLRLGRRVRAREIKAIDQVNFWNLADRVIPLVERESLTRFSLQISFTSNLTNLINNWLHIILSKKIQEITLDFADRDTIIPIQTDPYEVPSFFFQGLGWVKIIRLFSCAIPNESHFRGFANLTTLVLHGIRFKGITVNDSFLGCALLENLSIVECFGILKIEIEVGMKSLSRFVVQNCEAIREGIDLIHAPVMEHFEYHGTLIRFNFEGAFFLDSVILDFVETSYPYRFWEIDHYFSRIMFPKYFTITTPALKIAPAEHMFGLPMVELHNVDVLTLKTGMNIFEMAAIRTFLQGAKYMRSLIFVPHTFSPDLVEELYEQYEEYSFPDNFWHPGDEYATMPLLQRVELGGFGCKELELKVLSFILKCSKNLRKVVLKPDRGRDIHQLASSDQFQALLAEKPAGSGVKFEWRYS